MKKGTNRFGRLVHGVALSALLMVWTGCEEDYKYIAPPPTQPVSLSLDIQPIFDAECDGCHSGSLPPDLRAGNSHASLWATGDIDTANPVNSVLYQRIVTTGSGAMPPGGPQLPNHEINLILTWIEEGAQNN